MVQLFSALNARRKRKAIQMNIARTGPMTLEDIQRYLKRFSVQGGGYKAWDVWIEASGSQGSADILLSLSAAVPPRVPRGYMDPNVMPGDAQRVYIREALSGDLFRLRETAEHILQKTVLQMFKAMAEHEVYEGLLFDGERKWDPHATAYR